MKNIVPAWERAIFRVWETWVANGMLKRIAVIAGLLLGGCAPPAGAERSAAPDWASGWAELRAREDLGPEELLREQTRLLIELAPAEAWREPRVWDWAREALAGWEASSRLAEARQAYLNLLQAVGTALEDSPSAVPFEPALREYFRRALNIADTPEAEARLLMHMADSWLRSAPDLADHRRRAESLLQQAAALLHDGPPLDAVRLRLGRLHVQWGAAAIGAGPPPGGLTHFTQAVAHLQAVAGVSGADPALLEQAARLLDELLRPGLELDPPLRFLPQDEVRLTVRARNAAELLVEVVALPAPPQTGPLSLAALRDAARVAEGDPERLRFRQSLPVVPAAPHDWEVREIRLGDDFGSGWYGVRVAAAGLERRDVLLVSALQLAAVQRPSGEQLLWRVEAETGRPVPMGAFYLYTKPGATGAAGAARLPDALEAPAAGGWSGPIVADGDGTALLPASAAMQWQEIHTADGADSGLLVRPERDESEQRHGLPWAAANATLLLPGASFEWCLAGTSPAAMERYRDGVHLRFPGRSEQLVRPRIHGADWMLGEAQVPSPLAHGGPVYLELPDGGAILLAHVLAPKAMPLAIEFSGERLDADLNLFLASSPVSAEILAAAGIATPLPDFVRVRGTVLRRVPGWTAAPSSFVGEAEQEPLFERIVPFHPAEGRGARLELPLGVVDELLALRVEARSLDGSVLLGEAFLGLSPYRSLVRLRMEQRIIRPGQPVTVEVTAWDPQQARIMEGYVVVYRERWQSRYVHRRRGTLITEEEYQALPERSMLGMARTDFRLAEQGFVRQEIQRRRVVPGRDAQRVSLPLDQPGYYHITFESRDADVRAHYPDGPLEFWVIRDDADVRQLRANRPRLVVEQEPDGSTEILVLTERPAGSVLVDVHLPDGTALSRVLRPEGTASFLQQRRQPAPPGSVRVLIAGERGIETLYWQAQALTRAQWSLAAPQPAGHNPGAPFAWELDEMEEAAAGPLFWTFHADAALAYLGHQARWQERLRHPALPNGGADFVVTSQSWRRLFNPLAAPGDSGEAPAKDAGVPEPEAFVALFPELQRSARAVPPPVPLHIVTEPAQDGKRILRGELPNAAGSWFLTVFSAAADRPLVWQAWPVSTELPIRMALDGPPRARPGDSARMRLSVENTTRSKVSLHLELHSVPPAALPTETGGLVPLEPGQRSTIHVPVSVSHPGNGEVAARVSGDGLHSQARFEVSVPAPPRVGTGRYVVVPPGEPAWHTDVEVPDWAEARLVIAASLGWLIPEVWAVLRDCSARGEPLLTALMDWALWQVLSRHRLPTTVDGPALTRHLAEQLRAHQAAEGGWAWLPGFPADPWLSALVLWTVATFAHPSAESFDVNAARAFLESVLIAPSRPVSLRLFALRALAAHGPQGPAMRPTRLQARSFLDLFHRRADFDRAELAVLLEVARLLRFTEEVGLLTTELRQRSPAAGPAAATRLWPASLVYLALEDRDTATERATPYLRTALQALAEAGPRCGWEQIGGLLNVTAVFLFKGEFHVDGFARVAVANDPLETVVLAPEPGSSGLTSWPVAAARLRGGLLAIRADTSQAGSPLLLALLGEGPAQPPPTLPGMHEQWFREFQEETLLAGPARRFTELTGPFFTATVGDQLEAHFSFFLDQPWDNVELLLPVPACALVDEATVRLVSDAPGGTPPPRLLPPGAGLERVLRLASLPAGQHTLVLGFTVQWEGNYSLPAGLLRHARTGEAYATGTGGRLQVAAAGN